MWSIPLGLISMAALSSGMTSPFMMPLTSAGDLRTCPQPMENFDLSQVNFFSSNWFIPAFHTKISCWNFTKFLWNTGINQILFFFVYINIYLHFLGEQFVAQNRGINSGKDIPRDILEMIYDSIKGEPFKIPDESYDDLMYTFFSPEKEGWLLKQGGG